MSTSMMILSELPRTLPRATATMTRIAAAQYSRSLGCRAFHTCLVPRVNPKAGYATVVQQDNHQQQHPLPPTEPQKNPVQFATEAPRPIAAEKRDFHWQHPVYTREEYESVKVYRRVKIQLTIDWPP
jgi:hypothetical protein